MRILIFTVCFPPVINGVSTRYAMTVQNLMKQGHEVLVATPGKNAPSEYYGAKVVKVPGFSFPLNDFAELDGVCSEPVVLVVRHPFRLLLPHSRSGHYISGFIGTLVASFMWFLLRILHNSCDLTMVTSDIMGKELREHGISNDLAVWRKGVDTELFHPSKASTEMRCRLMPDPSKTLLLYAGRLSLEKGLPLLAKVLEDKRLKGKVHLALIGDGPIRKQLESRTFARVRSAVSFHGFMSQEELAYAYQRRRRKGGRKKDVFVFPSETETLGLVAIEAMAGGLPVVGVAARGMTVTVKHEETGFLYPPGDVNMCVQYILSLIENPDLRTTMSNAARKDAEEWGWDKATRQLVEVYEETLEKCKQFKANKIE